jgi:hypothetical protein
MSKVYFKTRTPMKKFNKRTIANLWFKIIMPVLLAVFMNNGLVVGQPKSEIPSDKASVQRWVEQHFAKGKIPPFSFLYGGKSSNNFIKNWQNKAEIKGAECGRNGITNKVAEL